MLKRNESETTWERRRRQKGCGDLAVSLQIVTQRFEAEGGRRPRHGGIIEEEEKQQNKTACSREEMEGMWRLHCVAADCVTGCLEGEEREGEGRPRHSGFIGVGEK